MLKDSIRNDPEVFASVFRLLKKYENKDRFALEAATQSPLDSLFDILPKETLQLESYSCSLEYRSKSLGNCLIVPSCQ